MPMKSENDVEMANLKATLMLSYGYVAYYCPTKLIVQKLEGTILRFLATYFENAKVIKKFWSFFKDFRRFFFRKRS